MKSTDDMLSEEDAKNAPREVMRLVNRMMSGDGVDVVSDEHSRYPEFDRFLALFAGSYSPICSPHAETRKWWVSYERFDEFSAYRITPDGLVVRCRNTAD